MRMKHAQKEQLRAYFESHSDLTQHDLSAWAQVTFKLALTPGRKMTYWVLNGPSIVTMEPRRQDKTYSLLFTT